MTNRRTLFHHRKDKPRSVSKIGLLLCLLLAGGVMVVPASSGIVLYGKAKVRDLALTLRLHQFQRLRRHDERRPRLRQRCRRHAAGGRAAPDTGRRGASRRGQDAAPEGREQGARAGAGERAAGRAAEASPARRQRQQLIPDERRDPADRPLGHQSQHRQHDEHRAKSEQSDLSVEITPPSKRTRRPNSRR